MDILKYKSYEGTAELDVARGICRGKVLFIDDLITYESLLPSQIQSEFESAVDDYLDTCVALKKAPDEPAKGLFNVRVSPEMHRAAKLRALRDETSLNEVIQRALDAYVNSQPSIINHSYVLFNAETTPQLIVTSAAQTTPQWVTQH